MIFKLIKALRIRGFRSVLKTIVDRACMQLYILFGVRYAVKRILNYNMILDFHDHGICKQLIRYEIREPDHWFILNHELKPGMIVLECGANIGYYSLMMGKIVGGEGRIHAFEPGPYNYHLLNLNVLLNGMENIVRTYNMGISNKRGEESLYISEMSNCHTFYPKDHLLNSDSEESYARNTPVPMTTIAHFVEENGFVDFIRMDVEGYEVEILTGLLPLLDGPGPKFYPRILVETHRPRYDEQSHDIKGPLRKLFQAGYYVKYLVSDFHLRKNGRGAYWERGYTEKDIVTYLKLCDRAIYQNITNEDAIYFICDTDFVRGLMLVAGGDRNGKDRFSINYETTPFSKTKAFKGL